MSENSNTVEVKDEKLTTKSKSTKTEKVLFIIGIVLIVLMLPILIFDAVLLIKSPICVVELFFFITKLYNKRLNKIRRL